MMVFGYMISWWLIIALLIGIPVGIGFIIMAHHDMRAAHYKVQDYPKVVLSILMLSLAMAVALQLEAPTPLLWWIVLPFKIFCFAGVAVFSWLVEILLASWVLKMLFPIHENSAL